MRPSRPAGAPHARSNGLRRGSALILVLLMTLAVAALAVAAIFMTSSAGLLSRFYDRERLFGLAAESGLELALSRLRTDQGYVLPDTGMTVVLSGVPVRDADGNAIAGASVFVYAMVTGDTAPSAPRTITLLARAYDAFGTRHVRRMDLLERSLTRFQLFVDSLPSSESFGPATVAGRVHSNGDWRSANNARYLDSVTAVGSILGSSVTYRDSVSGAREVPFPRDSTYAWLATIAASANLSHTPLGTGRTRLEFVAYDTDGDGLVEEDEQYVRVLQLNSSGAGFLEVNPTTSSGGGNTHHPYDNRIVQNQCGAFYRRSGRWHFLPVATHRTSWAQALISTVGAGDWPAAPANLGENTPRAAKAVLEQPTSRCYPAGSPYLVNTERMTMADGTISGTASSNNFPWGTRGGAATRYGGSDTTFTRVIRTCDLDNTGECVGDNAGPFGTWLSFGGTADAALPDSMRAAHWPVAAARNAASQGVVNISGDVSVSGTVVGAVTLRVGGAATIIDRLAYATDPNDPSIESCRDRLGIIATGDILGANSVLTRVRRFGTTGGGPMAGSPARYLLHLGGEPRLTVHGHLLSTGGTVGATLTGLSLSGANGAAWSCATPGGSTATLGGCLAHTGSAAMRVYRAPFNGFDGHHPYPAPDRCSEVGRRPPFYPAGAGYTVLRTLEIQASRANTNARIEALLRALRGAALN